MWSGNDNSEENGESTPNPRLLIRVETPPNLKPISNALKSDPVFLFKSPDSSKQKLTINEDNSGFNHSEVDSAFLKFPAAGGTALGIPVHKSLKPLRNSEFSPIIRQNNSESVQDEDEQQLSNFRAMKENIIRNKETLGNRPSAFLKKISRADSGSTSASPDSIDSTQNKLKKASGVSIVRQQKMEMKDLRGQNIKSPRTAALPEVSAVITDMKSKPRDLFYIHSGIFREQLVDCGKHPDAVLESHESSQFRFGQIAKNINGRDIVIFLFNGEFLAFNATCCHQGADLSKGRIRADIEDIVDGLSIRRVCLQCPRHQWWFDIRTGELLHKHDMKQDVFPCKLDLQTGEIMIGFKELNKDTFLQNDNF